MPEGYTVAGQPPTAAQLEFGSEAGDALVGKHILFHWEGVGWCEGVIDSRNTDASLLMDEETGDVVNFVVYYAIDDDRSQHNLELKTYGGGPTAEFDNWVLLELAPSASSAEAADAEDAVDADAADAEDGEDAEAADAAAPLQAEPEDVPQQAPQD